MPDQVRAEIEIDAPPERVFDLAMQPERTPEWVTIVLRVERSDDGPLGPGYEMTQRLCLRGVPFTVTWKLTAYEPGAYARWEGKGPARSKAITENKISKRGDGTHFVYTNEFKTPFGPLGAVAGKAIMGGLPDREAKASLEALKKLAEREVG